VISIADTVWEVLSLAGIFILGLAVLPMVCRSLSVPLSHGLGFYLWHSLFCIAYIFYSLANPADTIRYFLLSLTWSEAPALGTRFVIFFNSFFTQDLRLSYGGAFFVYNLLGSIGLIAFSAALRESFTRKSTRIRRFIALLPFLPGFSFWSTAIGKDSIAFFGVGLICWAAASPYRRFPVILVGLAAMLAVRPHIAGILLIALALAFTLVRQGSLKVKLVIISIVLPTSVAAVMISVNYVGLEEGVSVDILEAYVDQRQTYNTEGGSSVDLASMSLPMRMFTYVFRPLFFDAGGLFGLVVSFENLILLLIFISSLYGLLKRNSTLNRFQLVFFSLYVMITWLSLANTTANMGIAIRQKTMFSPMLLMLMLSYLPNIRFAPQFVNHPGQRWS
jgi:hypothetical protein